MMRQHHSKAFQEQALRKVFERGDRTVKAVADELGLNLGTVKNWLKEARRQARAGEVPATVGASIGSAAGTETAAARLELLLASAGLGGEAMQAWCRERGIYAHQLAAWKKAFAQESDGSSLKPLKLERDALKVERDGLQRQLLRRDKALAEAAALLVLSKKFQALLAGAVE